MIYFLSFIVLLSIVVVVHEFGHFYMARLCGVKVEEFSLGFGKELFGWVDKKGTRWKVCLVPFGGYVKMYGDADAASMGVSDETVAMTDEDKKVSFYHQSLWKKVLIVFMGPAMNYIFAVVVLTIVFSFFGQLRVPPIIDKVAENSAADIAGITTGDEIISINKQDVDSFTDIKRLIIVEGYNNELDIVVDRAGKEISLKLTPEIVDGTPMIGIFGGSKAYLEKSTGVLQSFVFSVKTAYTMTADTLSYVKQLITGSRPADDLRGPLGIAEASGDAMQQGLLTFIVFLAQVSIGIGLINLFPIPMLDGGHLVVYFTEAVTRKPLGQTAQNVLGYIGIGFLIFLMIITFKNDIVRIFERLTS